MSEKKMEEIRGELSGFIYKRSRGCETPQLSCEHLPYLVEFDNFGEASLPVLPMWTVTCLGMGLDFWYSLYRKRRETAGLICL
jgi:hypothetical protein